ncbi:DUF1836 domain-containing protein [Paraliobacillus ryukyuensis]|uniref:DUF1836 domain-containing protein n=1 Tax=Paraliobacillus ryukyuensis TaxID=200904 RepID=UPI0009A5FDDA|nr:DUF1836 domain-containing protein [Paraliobacillus ryukyuensis]
MEDISEIINQLGIDRRIRLEDIPSIDLYMDQVTQLFENTYRPSKRKDEEKVLTKTMINNYAKGKLLFPIQNKKYSREHIMLIQLIYQLKGGLSINDVRIVLANLNDKMEKNDIELDPVYQHYSDLQDRQVEAFHVAVQTLYQDVQSELADMQGEHGGYLEQLLLVTALIQQSNMYRRLAEQIVDQMGARHV